MVCAIARKTFAHIGKIINISRINNNYMKKYMSFYHLVVEVYSSKSGSSEVIFDDYYTPQIAGHYDEFNKLVKSAMDTMNYAPEVVKNGGEFRATLTTCCFNNGKGRSAKSQTNVQSYLVKENCEPLTVLSEDGTFMEAMMAGRDWVKEQKQPF